MEVFLVYLWLKLNTFIVWSIIASISVFIGLIIIPSFVLATDGDSYPHQIAKWREESAPGWEKRRRLGIKLFIPFFCFALFTPSSTDTAILVASSIAVDVAKSPEGTKVGQLLRLKANELLDEELKKLSPQPSK